MSENLYINREVLPNTGYTQARRTDCSSSLDKSEGATRKLVEIATAGNMMLRKKHILGILVMLWTAAATAAPGGSVYVKQVSPFPTLIGQDSVGMPYLGGFNDPKPSLLDIDRDGLIDLI
ncbi:MAG: hypothetical protein D6800_07900, partial [Candidatus Zixiibacteriota bacterium]